MDQTTYSGDLARRLEEAIGSVIVGKPDAVRAILVALFAGLHALVEDIPGVGKTTLAKTVARATGLDFGRIQFTPDLLPGDIVGMTVWNTEKRDFVFRSGAIMHQFILADEINRASARTQSALLEAMQEESVTVEGRTYDLPSPFFVLATQNPIQFAGTFMLPEGQLDRFGVCVSLGYPDSEEEMQVLRRFRSSRPLADLAPVTQPAALLALRTQVQATYVDEQIERYITSFAGATRSADSVDLGMSPRGSLHLMKAAQAFAHLSGRDFVVPEDVANAARIVVPHKLILSEEARMEGFTSGRIVDELLTSVPKPDRIS